MILRYKQIPWYNLLSAYFGFMDSGGQSSQSSGSAASPGSAECVCANRSVVPATDSPCGDVIKRFTYGACWESGGLTTVCDGTTWLRVDYGAGKYAWVARTQVMDALGETCSGSGGKCSSVHLVTRASWGSRAPVEVTPSSPPPLSMLFVHHTATPACTDPATCEAAVRGIQDFHMDDRGWSDIGYTYLVGGDGRVYEGRGWDTMPAQCKGHNAESYGVAIVGDYMTVLPPAQATRALRDIVDCAIQQGKLTQGYETFGHRDGRCTSCPGDALYAQLQTWPRYSHRHINVTC